MDYRVLGPLEVVSGGESLPLGGPKQRSVLAMLTLSANRVVSVDRLIEGVWGDEANAKAGATLQTYISNLRRLLEPGRTAGASPSVLVGQRPGYVLRVDASNVDLFRFDSLVAVAREHLQHERISDAATGLQEALALWRGPALADLATEPFAAAEIVWIEQARLIAVEEHVDADLALGRHLELIPELEGLVARYPLRERLWGQLIVALYRSERQADALAAYARARQMLADELGIDPGPALREVERAILAQDLDVPAPIARTATAPTPVRIPVPADALIGRESEVAMLAEKLTTGDERAVSLTGPGGIGKTRLALAAAAQIADTFSGGSYFVELAPVTDPEQVAAVIAVALGKSDPGDDDPEQVLADLLADRQTLLVLDNLEQVIDVAPMLSRLLRASPQLRLLVTSRIPLRISGEHEYQVAGLPTAAEGADLIETRGGAAVALFESRARAVRPTFAVDAANVEAVADVCRRLEGVPLAVELAAARVRMLSVDSIRSRLDDSLNLLNDGPRDAPARHRTLRATIEWSVALLAENERAALGKLSMFVDGFDLPAAVAVCGQASEPAIDALVSCSLLRVTEVGDEPRFHLLEPVRQYAEAILRDPTAEADEHARYVAHFMASGARQADAIDGPMGDAALTRMAADQSNYSSAMDLAISAEDTASATQVAIALVPFWLTRGRLTEGRSRLTEVLALLPDGSLRAAAQVATGRLAYQQTDLGVAAELLTAALAEPALLDESTRILASCLLAAIAVMTGDIASGRTAAEQALLAAAEGGHYTPHVVSLSVSAIAAAMSGDFEHERSLYEERLRLTRAHGDRVRIADTLTTLGEIAFDEGDYPQARTLVREAFAIADTAARSESRDALIMLGRIAIAERDVDRAEELLDEAMHRAIDVGQSVAIALCVRVHGAKAMLSGDWSRAARLFGAAAAIRHTAMTVDVPVEADLAKSQEECRARLGDEAFEDERQAGARMDQAQIIAETLLRGPNSTTSQIEAASI